MESFPQKNGHLNDHTVTLKGNSREAFRQDGTRAWEAYQATGLLVTHVEADAWLEKLEAGNDVEPPKCHV